MCATSEQCRGLMQAYIQSFGRVLQPRASYHIHPLPQRYPHDLALALAVTRDIHLILRERARRKAAASCCSLIDAICV